MSEEISKYENELPEIVKLKIDVAFKKLFGDSENRHILRSFISSVLNIPKESITGIEIENVELLPDYADEKFGRVDLKVILNAEKEDELKMLEKSDIPEIRDAVTVVRTFSADTQMRIDAFEREMAMLDHLAEISAAKRDGRAEAEKEYKEKLDEAETERKKAETEREKAEIEREKAENEKEQERQKNRQNIITMLSDNLPDEMIIKYSGINAEELQKIKDEVSRKQ